MAEENDKLVNATINGREISAPASLNLIQALWHSGYPRVEGVGCLEGVCGSCRVLLRRAHSQEVTSELGCEVLIEEGMEVTFFMFPTLAHHAYQLDDIPGSREINARFHLIFTEAKNCRHCGGCVSTCPRGIEVEYGVELALKGRFSEAGDLFEQCVMCDLCLAACPEQIAPNHVGLFSRRVTACFGSRPSNLMDRLEKMRAGDFQVEW